MKVVRLLARVVVFAGLKIWEVARFAFTGSGWMWLIPLWICVCALFIWQWGLRGIYYLNCLVWLNLCASSWFSRHRISAWLASNWRRAGQIAGVVKPFKQDPCRGCCLIKTNLNDSCKGCVDGSHWRQSLVRQAWEDEEDAMD